LDDFESGFGKWTSNAGWGTDGRFAYKGRFSMSSNPGDRYGNNADSYALYNYAFDLTAISNPQLTFWSQTFLADGDSGFVEISVDQGLNWEMLGNAFSGFQTTWEYKEYSFQNYTGLNDVHFRFHFISDSTQTHIGWFIDDIKFSDVIPSISGEETGDVPNNYVLFNNYPNPFNPETSIHFTVPKMSRVTLVIYDILGRKIRTLVSATKAAGSYNVTWNGKNDQSQQLASGLYFYKLQAGEFSATKKMMLLK